MGERSGKNMITKFPSEQQYKIHEIGTTNDTLTSRGGLSFFVRYLDSMGIYSMLLRLFPSLKKSSKGFNPVELFKQLFCYFIDGTYSSISGFDVLSRDEGYAAGIESSPDELYSSHTIKRFFNKFNFQMVYKFRYVLQNLFIMYLKKRNPETIFIMVDSMVLDNNSAEKRHGVQPTYKKVKGFQPLHFICDGLIIDCVFCGGSKHGNHGSNVKNGIKNLVGKIRREYSSDVEIVFLFDAGFFDDDLFSYIESPEINAYYIATGKKYEFVKEIMRHIELDKLKEYKRADISWKFHEFEYKCQRWKKGRRGIYTIPYKEEIGQLLLNFGDSESIILTNIHEDSSIEKVLPGVSRTRNIIRYFHSRGGHEQVHRQIKEFRDQKLPFKRFEQNAAFYYFALVSYFVFSVFTEDCLVHRISGIKKTSYPNTIRRKFIDFAAKIVKTGNRTLLKTTPSIYKRLRLFLIFERCRYPSFVL